MDPLSRLENESIYILREAYKRFRKVSLLWSIGKDSTAMLWIARKAFLGKLPFPVLHIDTGYKFPEIYEFRDRYEKAWGLDLVVAENKPARAEGMAPARGRFECCNALKTEALKIALRDHRYQALFLAIRRDEHGIRAKERYFSPRNEAFTWDYANQPPELWNMYKKQTAEGEHLRVHPMLQWSELDIWRYTYRERIPTVSLYFAKKGLRYRSIGCAPCCNPVSSKADTVKKIIRELETTQVSERSGRAQDKEDAYNMQKLRSLGYM